jgi:hypothetical protein
MVCPGFEQPIASVIHPNRFTDLFDVPFSAPPDTVIIGERIIPIVRSAQSIDFIDVHFGPFFVYRNLRLRYEKARLVGPSGASCRGEKPTR